MKSKLKLAKLELSVFLLLEKTNKEFTHKWEKRQNPDNELSFQDCIQNYQTVRELIEHNRKKNTTSLLLESYYLEAWLGEIQSHLNDLPQNTSNEDIVSSNDENIKKLTRSFYRHYYKAKALNLQGQKNKNKALLKDYHDLFKKISENFSSWDNTIYERKAAYYYNLAENLINEAHELSEDVLDFDLKKTLLSTSITCLETAHNFYEQYGQHQYANETLQYQKKIEDQLKQLKKFHQSASKTKKTTKSIPKTSIDSKIKLQKSLEPKQDGQPDPSSSSLSRKRMHWKNSDEERPVRKQLRKTFPDKPIIKKSTEKEKSFETPLYPSPSTLNNEEALIQHREEEFKQVLNQISIDDPFRFYAQLFYKLNQQLHIYSKESSNHTLLTQLSWLTLSQQLMDLIPHKNQQDSEDLLKINDIRIKFLDKHKKNLNVISQQKRNEAYSTYELSDLRSRNLQILLIDEVFDYYYGLEAFKQTSAALSFLDLTSQVIKNYRFKPFEEIKNTIQSVHKLNESLFYAKLLRELIKFHVCQENANWHKSTFSSENKANLNKEYLKILTIAENFAEQSNRVRQDLRRKIQLLKTHLLQQFEPNSMPTTHSMSSFFQPIQRSYSIEELIKILQEHFQCLLKYKAPGIHSQDIYKHLVRFIHTHCKEQVEMNNSWTSQLSNIPFLTF